MNAFFRRRKKTPQSNNTRRNMFRNPPPCPLLSAGITEIDYKDVELLSRYVTEEYAIQPAALSNVSAKMQRQLKNAIKRARFLALLPYSRGHALGRNQ
jgi:small subunit ribosomal protein S18